MSSCASSSTTTLHIATIYGGQDNDLPVTLIDEEGIPVKLTVASGLTEISAEFPKPAGKLTLTKTAGAITIVDEETGRIKIRVTKENMALLRQLKDKAQSFQVFVDRTIALVPDRKMARFEERLIIQPPLIA